MQITLLQKLALEYVKNASKEVDPSKRLTLTITAMAIAAITSITAINSIQFNQKTINTNASIPGLNYQKYTYTPPFLLNSPSLIDNFIYKSYSRSSPLENSVIREKHQERSNDLARITELLSHKMPNCFRGEDALGMKDAIDEFSTLLDKYARDINFIVESLQKVHGFLNKCLFAGGVFFFSADDKAKVWTLGPLFEVMNQYITSLQTVDPVVYRELKLQLANLPKPKPSHEYPNLKLTEKEKLEVLLEGIKQKELAALSDLKSRLGSLRLAEKEHAYLAKLLSTSSELPIVERMQVRADLEKSLGARIQARDDVGVIEDFLSSHIPSTHSQGGVVTDLYRLSKARAFFEKQENYTEEQIFIPTWYHATKKNFALEILKKGEIEVRHKGSYRGSFVSTQREDRYGKYAFAMTQRVVLFDSEPDITSNSSFMRWRGLQQAISLKATQLLGVVSYAKATKKDDKPLLQSTLAAEKYSAVMVLSEVQLDFMQRLVTDILGCPDLPDGWWGGDKLYSEHQMAIQAQAKALAENNRGLLEGLSGQECVSQVVQKMVLPIYKEVMPPNPSYKEKHKGPRSLLARNFNRHVTLEKLAKKESTARDIHGTMHATRVALWSQLLRLVYEKFDMAVPENTVHLALTAALHDAARENEGVDYWDDESAELVAIQLRVLGVPDELITGFRQAVSEKDPKDFAFTTSAQAIVHDSDCLDIMRLYGHSGFRPDNLNMYRKLPEQKEYLDALIREVADFIRLTESALLKTHMEHESQDFFGDLVRLLFLLNEQTPNRFKTITDLLHDEMQGILKTKENAITSWVLNHLSS